MQCSSISFEILCAALNGTSNCPSTSDFHLNVSNRPQNQTLRSAAVLVPIVQRQNQLNLVLTKRADALRNHPGQIAFPGGKVDSTDSNPEAAALREAQEEIGLPASHIKVIGALPRHETVTGFDVHPFVAQIDPQFVARPDANEVDEVFEVPLNHILKPDNYRIEGWVWQGQTRYYYLVPYGPYYIWGATARMLRMLAHQVELTHAN